MHGYSMVTDVPQLGFMLKMPLPRVLPAEQVASKSASE